MDLLFIVAPIVWVLCVWSLFGNAVLTITYQNSIIAIISLRKRELVAVH